GLTPLENLREDRAGEVLAVADRLGSRGLRATAARCAAALEDAPVALPRQLRGFLGRLVVDEPHVYLGGKVAEHLPPGLLERRRLQHVDRLRGQERHAAVLAGQREELAVAERLSRDLRGDLAVLVARQHDRANDVPEALRAR